MKKTILLSVLVLLLIPSTAYAFAADPLTVTIHSDGMGYTVTGPAGDYFTMTDHCNGTWKYKSLPYQENSFTFYYRIPADKDWGPIAHVTAAGEGLRDEDFRSCEAGKDRDLFKMWLLMRGEEGCILLSETHPSVERQQALCFPASDPDWTADRVACVGYVTADDYWPCDVFGFSRLPLRSESGPNLMKVWQRHKTRQQE